MAYLGFNPEKDDTYLKRLPSIICFASSEMKEYIPRATEYLDKQYVSHGRPTVEFRVVVSNTVKFNKFALWVRKDVDRGGSWFHAQLLFFGIIDVFKCRFVSDLTEEITDGVHWGRVKIEIDEWRNKLLDPNVNYVLTCGDITDCRNTLECI